MPNNQPNSAPATKNPLRPVLLVDRRTVNDYSQFLQHLLVGLADESCPCALICPPDIGTGFVSLACVEHIYHPMFKIPLFWLQNRRAVMDKLAKFKPTVLHCLCPGKTPLTRHLAQKLDIPYVVTLNAPAKNLLRPFICTGHCAALIASSKSIAEGLARSYRRFSDRIYQINMGAFVEETCVCFSKTGRVPSMVVTGRLDNPLVFEPVLSALRHLAIEGYEFMLVIIGTGRAERDIHGMIKALGLSQVVTIVGDVQPLRQVLAGADIFIQPEPARRCSSNLLEAMSLGMAVASCRGGMDEMLIENETAVFFDMHDELRVYSCLQKLLDKREFARQIALNAQSYIREHHSVSKMITLLIETYRNAQQWYKDSD